MMSRRIVRALVRFSFVFAGTALSCGGSVESSSSGGSGGTGAGGTGAGGTGAGGGGSGGVPSSGGGVPGGTGAVPSSGGSPAGGIGAMPGTGAGAGVIGGFGGGPAVCNGVECANNEECCLTTSKCFDPVASSTACSVPTEPGPQGQKACGASSQCAPGEFCQPVNNQLCLGPGFCQSKTNCGGTYTGAFCGCDGITYPNLQTACATGVAIVGWAACGESTLVGAAGGSAGLKVTYCAIDSQCASAEKCCGITGRCYDSSQPALCSFPPPGTSVPCLTDAQCLDGPEYCSGKGCTEPGGCVPVPGSGDCTGELAPVCGCDGKSYTNAKCAAAAGTRVAHDGSC